MHTPFNIQSFWGSAIHTMFSVYLSYYFWSAFTSLTEVKPKGICVFSEHHWFKWFSGSHINRIESWKWKTKQNKKNLLQLQSLFCFNYIRTTIFYGIGVMKFCKYLCNIVVTPFCDEKTFYFLSHNAKTKNKNKNLKQINTI